MKYRGSLMVFVGVCLVVLGLSGVLKPKPAPVAPAPITEPEPVAESVPLPPPRAPRPHVKRPALLPPPAPDVCEEYHPRALCRFLTRHGF